MVNENLDVANRSSKNTQLRIVNKKKMPYSWNDHLSF